jgi:hypothetical protein
MSRTVGSLDEIETIAGHFPGNAVGTARVPGRMRTRIVAVLLAAGISLTACGGRSASTVGADGQVITVPVPAPGPVPNLPVSPEAEAASPLPDVTVRRINGNGGFVQLKNELPSDKPLLVWFWAPH